MILAIDTSSKDSQVLLLDSDKKVVDRIGWSKKASQSELTLKNIVKLLDRNKKEKNELKEVFVNQGPLTGSGEEASFTGLKIGVTIANGLAFALKIPVFGVSLSSHSLVGEIKKFKPDKDKKQRKYIEPIYPKEPNIQL